MAFRFRGLLKVLLPIAAVAYPALVFYFRVVREVPTRVFSLFVMAFAVIAFIVGTNRYGGLKKKASSDPCYCLPSSCSA